MFPTRYVRLTEARQRFGAQVDRLGSFFSHGDPLADAVATALLGMPAAEQRALVEQMLRGDTDGLPGPLRALAPATLGAGRGVALLLRRARVADPRNKRRAAAYGLQSPMSPES